MAIALRSACSIHEAETFKPGTRECIVLPGIPADPYSVQRVVDEGPAPLSAPLLGAPPPGVEQGDDVSDLHVVAGVLPR